MPVVLTLVLVSPPLVLLPKETVMPMVTAVTVDCCQTVVDVLMMVPLLQEPTLSVILTLVSVLILMIAVAKLELKEVVLLVKIVRKMVPVSFVLQLLVVALMVGKFKINQFATQQQDSVDLVLVTSILDLPPVLLLLLTAMLMDLAFLATPIMTVVIPMALPMDQSPTNLTVILKTMSVSSIVLQISTALIPVNPIVLLTEAVVWSV